MSNIGENKMRELDTKHKLFRINRHTLVLHNSGGYQEKDVLLPHPIEYSTNQT
jgi:hypothetical protein